MKIKKFIFLSKCKLMKPVEKFNKYRNRMNEKILSSDNLILKRLFNLDTQAFQDADLDVPTKENDWPGMFPWFFDVMIALDTILKNVMTQKLQYL